MSKSCGMSNFNVDASPNLLPRVEKSSVRDDMKKAMKSTMLRRESGSVVTDAERKMAERPARPAPTKGAKQFDKAMQHPVLKNLGL